MITYGKWKRLSPSELLIYQNQEAIKIVIDTGGIPFEVNEEVITEENHSKTQPTRIGINLSGPYLKGRMVFTMAPSQIR